ncbi:hypothetical protein CBL_08481 [Carabus blaptoides fortunei]
MKSYADELPSISPAVPNKQKKAEPTEKNKKRSSESTQIRCYNCTSQVTERENPSEITRQALPNQTSSSSTTITGVPSNEDTSVTPTQNKKTKIVTPQDIRGYPKKNVIGSGGNRRRKGKTRIATDNPEKTEIENCRNKKNITHLNNWDFYFWGHFKSLVYDNQNAPESIEELKQEIENCAEKHCFSDAELTDILAHLSESEDEFDISDSEQHNKNEKNQNDDIYDINSMPLMFEDGIIAGNDDDKNLDDEIIDEDVPEADIPEKDIPPPRDPKKEAHELKEKFSKIFWRKKNLVLDEDRKKFRGTLSFENLVENFTFPYKFLSMTQTE